MHSYSQNHIDCYINWRGRLWRFTGLYGFPEFSQKHLTWDFIRRLQGSNNVPWLLGGDFIEVMSDVEKFGEPQRNRKCLEECRQTLDDYELRDVKPTGELFTCMA